MFVAIAVTVIGFVACEKQTNLDNLSNVERVDKLIITVDDLPSSREDVVELELNAKFNIPDAIYTEFITSLTFEDGNFRGCIYDSLEEMFDDAESDRFWAHFGFHLRSGKVIPSLSAKSDVNIYRRFKPKNGGCKQNSRWICTLVGTPMN